MWKWLIKVTFVKSVYKSRFVYICNTFVYTKVKFFGHWIKIGDLSENGRNVTKKQAGNTMEILSINLLEKIWENESEKKSVFRFL